jgi:hypothetical protein
MTKEELEILAKKVADETATEDEELTYIEELTKGADELLAYMETLPDVETN